MITASHNPPDFNGFKIKAPWGGSAAPETTAAVEALVDANPAKRGSVHFRSVTNYLSRRSRVTANRSLPISILTGCVSHRKPSLSIRCTARAAAGLRVF